MTQNYDPNDPRTRSQRAITNDGRFNYNRSFNVDTLPKMNGMPVIGNMDLDKIGIHVTPRPVLEKFIADNWADYGVYLN